MPKENQAATDGKADDQGTKPPAETQPAATHGAGNGEPEKGKQDPAKPEATKPEGGEPAKPDPEIAGLESQRGALLKDVEALRLEKRTLLGQNPAPTKPAKPAPAKPAAKTDDGEDGDEEDGEDQGGQAPAPQPNAADDEKIVAAVKPLQDRLSAFEKQAETDAIREFSKSPEFALISPERDAGNQNWERMKAYFVQRHSASARTKEAIVADLRDAYYAAFGEQLQRDAEQRGYARGAAEAQTAAAADIGGTGGGQPPVETVELTAAEKEAAEKLGLTPERYLAGKRKRGDI